MAAGLLMGAAPGAPAAEVADGFQREGNALVDRGPNARVEVPVDSRGFVVVRGARDQVRFRLAGAKGALRARGNVAAGPAGRGMSLSYFAEEAALKEFVVLQRPRRNLDLTFDVRLSSGLQAHAERKGAVVIRRGDRSVFKFAAPYMIDAAGARSRAITVRLDRAGAPGRYRLTYTPSRSWLGDESRSWPVAVDPTTMYCWVQINSGSGCEFPAGCISAVEASCVPDPALCAFGSVSTTCRVPVVHLTCVYEYHLLLGACVDAGVHGGQAVTVPVGICDSQDVFECDQDADGIPDSRDECPNEPGPSRSNGCPDRDLDSVPDYRDACPDEHGLGNASGCPPDGDGDGIQDRYDACPDEPGPASNDGCPVVIEDAATDPPPDNSYTPEPEEATWAGDPADDEPTSDDGGNTSLSCAAGDPYKVHNVRDREPRIPDAPRAGFAAPEPAAVAYLANSVLLPPMPPALFTLETVSATQARFTAFVSGQRRAYVNLVRGEDGWHAVSFDGCSLFLTEYQIPVDKTR
jgi:hypothetical protein